jgi:hypothetical protein
LALLAVLAAQLFLGSRITRMPLDYCFTKPFWLDEFHTLALVKERRADQMVSKLSRGGDFNPPALHLALWPISRLGVPSDEWLLRSFSCVAGLGGLVATYYLLRLRFPWRVAWLAVMGMWSSSPLLVAKLFDGRFYSFWFAGIALLCLVLSVRTRSRWQTAGVAAAAALTCSIHYFGIIALGHVAVGQWCGNVGDVRQRRLCAVGFTAGALTVVASVPAYLGQRAALPVATWVNPPTVLGSLTFVNQFLLSYALVLPALAYALQQLVDPTRGFDPSETGRTFRTYAGACSLILLPAALTLFSYVVQPAQVDRYAIPAVLAYAPVIALICRRLNRVLQAATALLFFGVGLIGAAGAYGQRPDYRGAASVARAAGVEKPLVVHSRHVAYPLFRYTGVDPRLVRVSYLYRGDPLTPFDELEQGVTRRMAALFDLPQTLEADELAALDEFFLVAKAGEQQRYPGWTAEPLDPAQGPGGGLHAYTMRRDR